MPKPTMEATRGLHLCHLDGGIHKGECTTCGCRVVLPDFLAPIMSALLDASIMFEQIERHRQMPYGTATLNQYVATGREIRDLLVRFSEAADAVSEHTP